jgi:hypothetical protein
VAYSLQPWQVFLAALAGWINRHQQKTRLKDGFGVYMTGLS